MNHYVPDFDMENDHNLNSTSSTITNHKVDDDILELLWQDGQVVAQPQTQWKPQPPLPPPLLPPLQPPPPTHQHLYMAEDEMATWLHYPLEDLYSELLSENQTSPSIPPISSSTHQPQPLLPPRLPPPQSPPTTTTTTNNFGLFSRMRGNNKDLDRTSSLRPGLTVVESNSTPALATARSVGKVSSTFSILGGGGGGVRLEKDRGSGELTISSSSGTSGGGTVKTCPTTVGSEDTKLEVVVKDKKRKSKEIEESINTQTAGTSQDLEHEAEDDDDDEKKHSRGHSTAKRSRAAQVHNLSERRRRDRINDRMKALQELIPRSNKSDKASMLDEAIEYLKSLQMQVQMMSMGCNMVPMMYPGYIPSMGMDMGMARPMLPYPPNIPGVNVPITHRSTIGPQFGSRFSIPPARMPCVSSSNLAGNEGGNQVGNTISGSYPVQSPPGMAQFSNMGDPYQQYMALQQMQMQMQIQMQMQQMQAVQNQSISQPGPSQQNTNKSEAHIGPRTSKKEREDDN